MSEETGRIVRFPFSRTQMGSREPPRDLGETPMTRALVPGGGSAQGHWCSRCRGIWYSAFGEVECPACGNRHG